jgi:hypothetical protein
MNPATWQVVPHGNAWGIKRQDGQVLSCQTEALAAEMLAAIQAGRRKQLANEPGMWSMTLEGMAKLCKALQKRVDELERRLDAMEQP